MIVQKYWAPEVTDLIIDKERGYCIGQNVMKYLSAPHIDAVRFACTNFDRVSFDFSLTGIIFSKQLIFF